MDFGLTIVGLGPGRWDQLTGEARAAIEGAAEIWLRPDRLPVVADLPAGLARPSFDHLFASGDAGDTADRAVATEVLRLAARPDGVLYAVPGHPLVDDPTVRHLMALAAERGERPRIIPGLSLIDAALARLGIDLLDGQIQIGSAPGLRADPARPLLIRRIDAAGLAAAAKRALIDEYPADHPVTLLRLATPGDGEAIRTIRLADLDGQDDLDPLTCAFLPAVPPDREYRTFDATRRIIARLRAPGGCPWDREQTPETLKPYVVEEAYEVVDAIDGGDPAKLAEELGDLLLQVVLHAQIASEAGDFTITDVIEAINTKLVRRHPHVFADQQVRDAREVLANWEVLKERERAPDTSLLQGLPRQLPALASAQTLQRKLARFGLRTTWDPILAAGLVRGLDGAPASAPADPGQTLNREQRTRRLARLLWQSYL